MRAGRPPGSALVDEDRQQRAATLLVDVGLCDRGAFRADRQGRRRRTTPGKHLDMFNRRARTGQCFTALPRLPRIRRRFRAGRGGDAARARTPRCSASATSAGCCTTSTHADDRTSRFFRAASWTACSRCQRWLRGGSRHDRVLQALDRYDRMAAEERCGARLLAGEDQLRHRPAGRTGGRRASSSTCGERREAAGSRALMQVPAAVKRTVGIAPQPAVGQDRLRARVHRRRGQRAAREHAAFKAPHPTLLGGTEDEGLRGLAGFLEAWAPERFDAPALPAGDARRQHRLPPRRRAAASSTSAGRAAACRRRSRRRRAARLLPRHRRRPRRAAAPVDQGR